MSDVSLTKDNRVLVEKVARVLCGNLQPEAYDSLPEQADYITRKSLTRPILDKLEARAIAEDMLLEVKNHLFVHASQG